MSASHLPTWLKIAVPLFHPVESELPTLLRLRIGGSAMVLPGTRKPRLQPFSPQTGRIGEPTQHMLGDRPHDGHHHRIAELLIGLRVGDRNNKLATLRGVQARQPRAFARR